MVVVLAQFTAVSLSLYTSVGSELLVRGAPAIPKPSARLRTANSNGNFVTFVSGTDFGFTQTER